MLGLVMSGLLAGGVCGLLPLILAISRKRTDLAIGGMLICVVLGMIGGLLFAGPAAAFCAFGIYAFVSKPRETDEAEALAYTALDRELPAPPEPTEAQQEGALSTPAESQPRKTKIAGPAIRCTGCGMDFWPGLGPTPPWCRHCGKDLPQVSSPPSAVADGEPTSSPAMVELDADSAFALKPNIPPPS
jgi:hypothetical protein